jgi:uncharacterized membrane protein YgcG
MRMLYGLLIASIVTALAAPALASAASNGTRGVVVQRDARGGAVVIATKNGSLQRVKFAKPNRLKMGTVLQVSGAKVAVVGHTHKAKLHGVVVRRNKHSFALAGNDAVLAVASTTPPAAGDQVTTTVQVGDTQLSDNDGECHVDDNGAASARVRGTVLTQDATTLVLAVPGFPAGLPIAIGSVPVPALAPGTAVKARVALGPDPNNAGGIVLNLVSLRIDDGQGGGEHGHQLGANVKAEGRVTAVVEAGAMPGSITIDGEHGTVMFAIPVGFGTTGAMVGDEVEAWGTAGATPADPPTLVRLEGSGGGGDHSGQGQDGNSGHGGNDSGNSGADD